MNCSFTYDHRTLKIELPVRSAVLKQCTGGLVVRWVTTGEYPLLYVFVSLFVFSHRLRPGLLPFCILQRMRRAGYFAALETTEVLY
jgi:hypothetical protein